LIFPRLGNIRCPRPLYTALNIFHKKNSLLNCQLNLLIELPVKTHEFLSFGIRIGFRPIRSEPRIKPPALLPFAPASCRKPPFAQHCSRRALKFLLTGFDVKDFVQALMAIRLKQRRTLKGDNV
jgi:hypothetical protein